MKTIKTFFLLFVLTLFFSCSNNTVVSTEIITVTIDGVTTDFSNNIDAKLIPVAAQTGLPDFVSITAEDNLSNPFVVSRIFTIPNGITLPTSGTVPIPESNFINVFGLDIDDGNAANNLTYTVTAFGLVGEQIEATISGTYIDSFNVQHTLQINIDVTRDQ